MLHLVGDKRCNPRGGSARYSIVIAGQVYWLTYQSFTLLAILAACRQTGVNGWMEPEQHPYRFGHKWHHVYRLREELRKAQYPHELIENDTCGRYRLLFSADAVVIDTIKIIDNLEVVEGSEFHQCLSRV